MSTFVHLKRALKLAAIVAVSATAVVVAGVWLLVRDEVATVRAMAAVATEPVPPVVAAAMVAAEDPGFLDPPRLSAQSFRVMLTYRNLVQCGPSPIAYVLVRSVSPPRRALGRHIETAAAAYAVGALFTPEELLRIYAHELYLGRLGTRPLKGVDAASRAYFGKTSRELSVPEAATIAGIIRSPNMFSPVKYPDRALERRNKVLNLMHRFGYITAGELHAALEVPLRTMPAPRFGVR